MMSFKFSVSSFKQNGGAPKGDQMNKFLDGWERCGVGVLRLIPLRGTQAALTYGSEPDGDNPCTGKRLRWWVTGGACAD